ncbi:MAG TPA: stalk domain-containing protein [Sedimentibacter sp.]|nr:stalk domain-containing protein [Sedimentibacter sp.]
MKIKYIKWPIFISLLLIIILVQFNEPEVYAENSIKLVIDGKKVKTEVDPYISNDRTLVPIRVIAEELDSEVEWDNDNRAVHISKEDIHIVLRIDSHLVEFTNDNETTYTMIDVAPQIKEDRTFVPIRLISNALGVGIEWNNDERAVYIDSHDSSEVIPFFDVEISSVKSGQTINGTTDLYTKVSKIPTGAKEIKYLLLDSDTAKGFVIAGGRDLTKTYQWVPAMENNGSKVLVAAFYDAQGKFLSGDSIAVTIKINPQIKLNGITEGQMIREDKVPLSTTLNFLASYVKYEMINPDNGATYLSPGIDPEIPFNMIPVMEDNGRMSVRVIAYDTKGNAYEGEYVNIGIDVDNYLYLGGVKQGQSIDGSVTLLAQRNFNVTDTEYYIIDNTTGEETLMHKAAYGSYTWFPAPEEAGSKDLYVKVKDTAGNTHISKRITVNVTGNPKLLLQGVGPGQVLTTTANLNVKTNVKIDGIKYILTNTKTGQSMVIAEGNTAAIVPEKGDDGSWIIRAEGTYDQKTIKTEEVKFTIYTGQLYSAKPVIEKDLYLDLVSDLAVNTRGKTGMSAALQVAQAILETGWGQSVPVDKYDGKFSYNLFGIKGEGTKGSVTSNTWEEYNGVAFRIDAEFRAYDNEKESWQDHKDLLLLRERYAPFREVMYDSTNGAWELKRCGYATDSQYAIKLIDIINRYDLRELDEVTI